MKFLNRDNRTTVDLGPSTAASKALDNSKSGAVKLAELSGTVFRNKDSKKGQQDAVKCLAELVLGHSITFPDTSNIRYHS